MKLSYLADTRPGICRIRRGAGFQYTLPNGRSITSSKTLQRIQNLVIPPAWNSVWISPSASSHLQATGRDAKGRKQYRYHYLWREARERNKFERLALFAKVLPRLRARVRRDLQLPGIPREKVLATVVRLLDTVLIRIGNEEYARQNHSYGLTTLRNYHANVRGSSIQFCFRGKSGKMHTLDIKDPRLARIIKRCQELPGQELFEYLDAEGQRHDIGSTDVNNYIRLVTVGDYTAKDFRIWHGSVLAATALRLLGPGRSKTQVRHNIVKAVKSVAFRLGNTPAVCRNSYIHPEIINAYEESRAALPLLKKYRGLSVDESFTLSLVLAAAQQKKQLSSLPVQTKKKKK